MRNWKDLLTQQIVSGYWYNHQHQAIALASYMGLLMNSDKDSEGDPLAIRGPLPIMAYDSNGNQGSSYDNMQAGSIAVFKIAGTMLKYGTWYSYGTEEIGLAMMEAANHPNIAACLFIVDSGGGAVNSVPPLRDGRAEFRKNNKPFVALADLACSAAYYVIADADHIMAANSISCKTGSIGVMMSWVDLIPYYKSLGIVIKNLYAPESSEKNKPFELALQGKFDLIKTEELSPIAQVFISDVIDGRGTKLKVQDDDKILKGKTYYAADALANGLIDSIGDLNQAIQLTSDLIQIRNYF